MAGTPFDDCPRVVRGPGAPHQPLSRFLLIGDVHAEDARLAAAIELGARERVERALCVGDVCDGWGDLDRSVGLLEEAGIVTVRGNHDRWFLRDEMRSLQPVQFRSHHLRAAEAVRLWLPFLELSTVRGPLLLCHAVGDDDFCMLRETTPLDEIRGKAPWRRIVSAGRFRFVAAGHSHQAMVRTIDDITVLNPGTLKRGEAPCVSVVDLGEGVMTVHDLEDATRPFVRSVLRFA